VAKTIIREAVYSEKHPRAVTVQCVRQARQRHGDIDYSRGSRGREERRRAHFSMMDEDESGVEMTASLCSLLI
jgi:hypothetical protein